MKTRILAFTMLAWGALLTAAAPARAGDMAQAPSRPGAKGNPLGVDLPPWAVPPRQVPQQVRSNERQGDVPSPTPKGGLIYEERDPRDDPSAAYRR